MEECVSLGQARELRRCGYPQFNSGHYWVRGYGGTWELITLVQFMNSDSIYSGLAAAPSVADAVFWKLQQKPDSQYVPFFKIIYAQR